MAIILGYRGPFARFIPNNRPGIMDISGLTIEWADGEITIPEPTPPDLKGNTLVSYIVSIDGTVQTPNTLHDIDGWPQTIIFTAASHPDVWISGDNFSINIRMVAVSTAGAGLTESPPKIVDILQDATPFIEDDDWTTGEITDVLVDEGKRFVWWDGVAVGSLPAPYDMVRWISSNLPGGLSTLDTTLWQTWTADVTDADAEVDRYVTTGTAPIGEVMYQVLYLVETAEIEDTLTWLQWSNVKEITMEGFEVVSPPVMVSAPTLTGSGKITVPINITPGVYTSETLPRTTAIYRGSGSGEPVFIANVTTVYTPVAADDGFFLFVRETVSNDNGSIVVNSAIMNITYLAPTIVGTISTISVPQGSAAPTVDIAPYFAGSNLSYSVSGMAGIVSISGSIITVSTDSSLSGSITISATNSGGVASHIVSVNITTIVGPPAFPSNITSGNWTAAEVVSTEPAGRRRITIANTGSAATYDDTDFELRMYSGTVDGGMMETSLTTLVDTIPEDFTTTGSLALGTTCFNKLFWRRIVDGAWQQASADQKSFVIVGLDVPPPPNPTGDFPSPPIDRINEALASPLPFFNSYTNGSSWKNKEGMSALTIAAGVLAENPSVYPRALQIIRNQLVRSGSIGRDPPAGGGYTHKYETVCQAFLTICRHNSVVWGSLTASEQNKVDLIIKAVGYVGAYCRHEMPTTDFRGGTNWWPQDNPNHRAATPASVLILGSHLSASGITLRTHLDGFTHSTFLGQLQSANLYSGVTYARTWGGSSPSAATIQSRVRGAQWPNDTGGGDAGGSVFTYIEAQWPAIMLQEAYRMFGRTIELRPSTISSSQGIQSGSVPNIGQTGMAWELRGNDSGGAGRRVSCEYPRNTLPFMAGWYMAMIAAGKFDRSQTWAQQLRSRTVIGINDLKTRLQQGHQDFSSGSNGQFWPIAGAYLNWGSSTPQASLGYRLALSLYDHNIMPWILGGV